MSLRKRVKSKQISIFFGKLHPQENWHWKKHKCAHLTYNLLLHYLGKCMSFNSHFD